MAVIRLDSINSPHLVSFVAPTKMTNGLFVQVGALVEGESQLREATAPVDVTGDNIVLHATPEVDVDPRKAGLKHFAVEQGEEGRGIRLVEGDIITLTEDLFATKPSKGDKVEPVNGQMKLDVVSTPNAKIRFDVIEETTLGYDNDVAFALEVVRA